MCKNNLLSLDTVPGSKYFIYQEKNAFRYCTDSIILSSFANVKGLILDAGCGNGILSLRIIDRVEEVYGVDKDENALDLFKKSILKNKIEKIKIINCDLKDLWKKYNEKFDGIIFNPPYFSKSLKSKDSTKDARHSDDLNMIVASLVKTLKFKGSINMVFPANRLAELISILRANKLEPKRLKLVRNTENADAKIFLIEAKKGANISLKIERDLILYRDGKMTEDLISIYGDER